MNRLVSITLVFLGIFSSSCGINKHFDKQKKPEGYVRQFSTTDDRFKSHVTKFENHAKIKTGNMNFKINDIPINFGDTENEQYVGVCFSYSDGKKEILIKAIWWNMASNDAKESLIFHELGHCALDRNHNEDHILNSKGEKIRASVMHPAIVSSRDYNEYYDGYVHELFTTDKGILTSLFN
ncbi:MAG: hypothetical protein KC493_03820 [Bacteriovoracaceae bacterium]|nr:hypothetical protein [Bacteriovoracaceae bacterium]